MKNKKLLFVFCFIGITTGIIFIPYLIGKVIIFYTEPLLFRDFSFLGRALKWAGGAFALFAVGCLIVLAFHITSCLLDSFGVFTRGVNIKFVDKREK